MDEGRVHGKQVRRSDVVTWGMIGVAAPRRVVHGRGGLAALTAPSANSPQYRRSDGLDDVVLGLVEEECESGPLRAGQPGY